MIMNLMIEPSGGKLELILFELIPVIAVLLNVTLVPLAIIMG